MNYNLETAHSTGIMRRYLRSTALRLKSKFATGRDYAFWVLAAFLIATFLAGGGSRGDIASLVVLRPLAALVLAYGIAGLSIPQIKRNWQPVLIMVLSGALVGLQLIPLPPSVWQELPGREIIREIDQAAGLGNLWRPLTMDPLATQNAFGALLVPAAAIVLCVRLDLEGQRRLLLLLIALVISSALVALLQGLGGVNSVLYFYDVTNSGALNGLFANRNHQALLLAMGFPLLAAWTALVPQSDDKHVRGAGRRIPRFAFAIAAAAFILPLLLVTGSRSGLVLGLLGGASTLLFRRTQLSRNPLTGIALGRHMHSWQRLRWILGILTLALILALALFSRRDLALDRLFSTDTNREMRLLILPTVHGMIRLYGVWGIGLGSFERVFQIHEPNELLVPTYMNHVHNDWLELILTGGVFGGLLLLGALILVVISLLQLLRGRSSSSLPTAFVWLGLTLVGLCAAASITDYPLRVPSIEAVFAIALVWSLGQRGSENAEIPDNRN